MHYFLWIDEAGRWPWAGPIVVGGFLIRENCMSELHKHIPWINDSKKLSEKRREMVFSALESLMLQGECTCFSSLRTAEVIDTVGIREANRRCMQDVIEQALHTLWPDDTLDICIDGCDNYVFENMDAAYIFAKKKSKKEKPDKHETYSQEKKSVKISYFIWWDGFIPVISLGSIIAKVLRDRMMCDFSLKFPEFDFSGHKGYGTRKHYQEILNYGIKSIHRKSYAPMKRLISDTSWLV